MEELIGVITYIDLEEHVGMDASYVLGTTTCLGSRTEVVEEALSLVQEHLLIKEGVSWKDKVCLGADIMIRCDVVEVGALRDFDADASLVLESDGEKVWFE